MGSARLRLAVREACAARIEWAFAQGVRDFVLSIAPAHAASAALARQQFRKVGTWVHDTRGEELVYRLRIA